MTNKQEVWMQSVIDIGYIHGHSIRRLIDSKLAEKCGIHGTEESETEYRVPKVTREQLFGLMRIVSPESSLALMCGPGITSAEDAKAFLEENDLRNVLVDNAIEVDEAIDRRADLSVFLEMIQKRKVASWRYEMVCSWADLAEFHRTSLRDTEIDYNLADGDVTWNFIKQVGITNVRKFPDEVLPLEGILTPAEIKLLIARADDAMVSPHKFTTTKLERLSLLCKAAKGIGVEDALALKSPGVFSVLREAMRSQATREYFTPDASDCRFIDDFIQQMPDLPTNKWRYSSAYAFKKHGFSVDETVAFITEGTDLTRAIEMREHGVPTAVSRGWL